MSRDGGRKVGGGAALGLLALASLLAARTADDSGPATPPTGPAPAGQEARSDWPAYGGDPGGKRYSPLDQLDRANVGRLAPAWTFRTGELGQGARDGEDLTFEATPIHFEGTLYIPTAFGAVFALDPVTGEERWRFNTGVPRGPSYSEVTSRGVSAWRDAAAEAGSPCAARLFVATIDARLIALDAGDGRPCEAFGTRGEVDLAALAGAEEARGDYQVTSAPAVIGDVVVVGPSIGDNWSVDTGDGSVRAFDARSGRLVWSWAPLDPALRGRAGAANAWSTISADPARGLVFVPTGSASPDFFGGLRPGDNRWANSVVALRAATGEQVWGFQTVHHDLFDYDVAAQPLLADVTRGGERIPAVLQATKTGFLFVLDRKTGAPLHPVEERLVPSSAVPEERASPTQPWPESPPPLIPVAAIDAARPWGVDEAHRAACREGARGARFEGPFTPPGLDWSLQFPGDGAGTNWGGAAFDPAAGVAFVPTLRYATLRRLVPRDSLAAVRRANAAAGDAFEVAEQRGAPYGMMRRPWIARGLPCTPPPWGVLTAVDPSNGEIRWEAPLGVWPGAPEGSGSAIAGGPIVTAGGLLFIGATPDQRLRALDAATGDELWSAALPAAAMATPMTYRGADGRQYVVVAAGGHGKRGLPPGDYVVAFALPAGG